MNGVVIVVDGYLVMEGMRCVNSRFYEPLVATCMLMNTCVLSREGHTIICLKFVDSSTTPLSHLRGVKKCICVRPVEELTSYTPATRVSNLVNQQMDHTSRQW